jgi:hypothetical protein
VEHSSANGRSALTPPLTTAEHAPARALRLFPPAGHPLHPDSNRGNSSSATATVRVGSSTAAPGDPANNAR